MREFDPDYRIAPGVTLSEIMGEHSKLDFAEKLGIPVDKLVGILRGTEPITHEYALKIARGTETPVSFWMERERRYRAPENKNSEGNNGEEKETQKRETKT